MTSLYNSTICEFKKENNFKKEKKGKGTNRLALFFLQECFSYCFNVDTVWLLLGFFLRISGSAWLKLDCLRESSFNMTRGGGGEEVIESRSLNFSLGAPPQYLPTLFVILNELSLIHHN